MTNEYEMITDPSKRESSDPALFPALAIPLQSKLDSVCPANHLQQLDNCLPEISKILIIGWRATDAPFLEMLYNRAPCNIPVQVVCESLESCMQVIQNMERAGLLNHYSSSKGGY